MRTTHLLAVLLSLCGIASGQQGYSYQKFSLSSIATFVLGINNSGAIVGGYRDKNDVEYGFVERAGKGYRISMPGATSLTAESINIENQIVGNYTGAGCPQYCAFILTKGIFATLSLGLQTNVGAINDLSQVTGSYYDGTSTKGYFYSGGSYTSFNYPKASYTQPNGINNAGVIVGTWGNAQGIQSGFIYKLGTFRAIMVPGAQETEGASINNLGEIAGAYRDPTNIWHGFVLSNGVITTIDYPGASISVVHAMNDKGDVIGIYQGGDCYSLCGFIATPVR